MEHFLQLHYEADFILWKSMHIVNSGKDISPCTARKTHTAMWSIFWREIRGSPLSPDIHFLSYPVLACSYPCQTLWINTSYDYKYDVEKHPKVENVKKFGDPGGVNTSLLNRSTKLFKSYTPQNCLLPKVFCTDIDVYLCSVRHRGIGYTQRRIGYVPA